MRDLAQFENRRPTKQINVGGVPIGNRNPVSIQTMTTTLTCQVDETMRQIERCAEAGAQIVRVAVPEQRDADALKAIVKRSPVPIVSDIHFNYKFALDAIDTGVAKVRINPGNIGLPKSYPQQRQQMFQFELVLMKGLLRKIYWINTRLLLLKHSLKVR